MKLNLFLLKSPISDKLKCTLLRFLVVVVIGFSSQLKAQELPYYTCFSDHFDINKYVQQYDRKFDSVGIITQKNEYHALTISFYGIMAYDAFNRTGDSTYYWQTINQYKYFLDTALVEVSDDEKLMGLPYHFKFHDLQAPWYSGMTQGAALSFVLRVHELTKNPSALKTAEQLAAFMLRPATEGGTIGVTPEGFKFIEEYPNSRTNKQVLNGFINGLIGLHEYLLFFPEDTLAQDIFEQSYDGMFAALNGYNKPSWTSYNRNGKSISNQYIRYQLAEFQHLYEIFADERLIDQMHIWGMMAYSKLDNTLKFYNDPLFQFSSPFVQKSTADTLLLSYTPKNIPKEDILLVSNLNQSYAKKKSPVRCTFSSSAHFFSFRYTKDVDTSKISLGGIPRSAYTLALDSETQTITIRFNSRKEKQVDLYYKKGCRKLQTSEWRGTGYEIPKYNLPFFLYSNKHFFQVEKNKIYTLDFEKLNTSNLRCYFRFAPTQKAIANVNWEIGNKLSIDNVQFDNPGFIEVMICCDATDLTTSISTPKLTEKL